MTANLAWQPTASIAALHARAQILIKIRNFFAARNVAEVETPILARFGVTDPYINAIEIVLNEQEKFYLQTSPEYAMKRLLAHGSGAIYQISKAFRHGDIGSMHNPEFTMLEWYTPGADHFALMTEVDELLQTVLQTPAAIRTTYSALFKQYLAIDPHTSNIEELIACARQNNINFSQTMLAEYAVDDWLNLLFADCIEPQLIGNTPWFVHEYPASQAALAKVFNNTSGIACAARFEVYYCGLELANGYHELTDPKEQQLRFKKDQAIRAHNNQRQMAADLRLLAALEFGLPECAGIALGIDRLVMLALGCKSIQEVIAFPIGIA